MVLTLTSGYRRVSWWVQPKTMGVCGWGLGNADGLTDVWSEEC